MLIRVPGAAAADGAADVVGALDGSVGSVTTCSAR
jgi:hypothetical protein